MKNSLMQGRINPSAEVQLVSDDKKVRITYHHNDLGMKYRVQVDTGARRMRWQTVGYGTTYLQVLNTFNRIVSDRARAFKFC